MDCLKKFGLVIIKRPLVIYWELPLGRPKCRWWDKAELAVQQKGTHVDKVKDKSRWRGLFNVVKSQFGHKWPRE